MLSSVLIFVHFFVPSFLYYFCSCNQAAWIYTECSDKTAGHQWDQQAGWWSSGRDKVRDLYLDRPSGADFTMRHFTGKTGDGTGTEGHFYEFSV